MIIAAVLTLAILMWPRPGSLLEHFEAPPSSGTIFVSVASYRDLSCSATIKDMYEKAKHPERIFVGACEQNATDANEACVPPNFEHFKNIRKISIPHTEAKGPTYARYLCASLYRDESYFMQIDSHTTFVKNWDEILIAEHNATPNPKTGILTGYPHDSRAHGLDEQSIPILCDSKFGENGIPSFLASVKKPSPDGKHFAVPFTAGGFVFGPGKMVRDVPFDPYLAHVFQGEEVLYSARLWTHGYDFYTARRNVIFHKYERKGEKRWHHDNSDWHVVQKASLQRVKRLLHLEEPYITNDPYGLGSLRTIDAYWNYAGLDPKTKTSKSKEKFC